MKYNAKNNPRVIIVQKIYSHLFNNEKIIIFPKHRFKKFIKDVVNGTLERDEIILMITMITTAIIMIEKTLYILNDIHDIEVNTYTSEYYNKKLIYTYICV